MNDITILHLSDLHMTETPENRLSPLYVELLKDIKTYQDKWEKVIIVVTGDLIDRYNYKAQKVLLQFFKELKDILSEKVNGIHIVPGNHDILRNPNEGKSEEERREWEQGLKYGEIGADFYKAHNEEIKNASKKYLRIVNKIYEIFGRKRISKEFGVCIDKVEGKHYCFIECASILNSGNGKLDKRNVRVGKYQIDTLLKDYNRAVNKLENGREDVAVTFLLIHYPINWLLPSEAEILQNFAIRKDRFDVDYILCGHIHNQDLYNLNRNFKSLMTLATGLSLQDNTESAEIDKHSYAVYNINIEMNSVEIYNRSTNSAMTFDNDTSHYNEEQIKAMEGKIIFPIQERKNKSYFMLSTAKERSSKPSYFTEEIIIDFHKYHLKMNQWFYNIGSFLYIIRQEIFNTIICDERDMSVEKKQNLKEYIFGKRGYIKNKESSEIREILSKYHHVINENLEIYLQYICLRMCQLFIEGEQEIVKLRVHFRYGYIEDGEVHYKKLCAKGNDVSGQNVSPAEWGDLIKEAFECKKALIYSVNKAICKPLGDAWDDYITVIPDFSENIVFLGNQNGIGKGESRPLLSFGITIKGKIGNMLYYFDYMNISKILGDVIGEYIDSLSVNFRQFVGSIREEKYE